MKEWIDRSKWGVPGSEERHESSDWKGSDENLVQPLWKMPQQYLIKLTRIYLMIRDFTPVHIALRNANIRALKDVGEYSQQLCWSEPWEQPWQTHTPERCAVIKQGMQTSRPTWGILHAFLFSAFLMLSHLGALLTVRKMEVTWPRCSSDPNLLAHRVHVMM